jgi:hypothetical protein
MKALMTLALVLLLAGCAARQGDAGRTKPEETTANGTDETTLTGEGGLPRPSDSTLSYGGQEVKGTLGSYCWSTHSSAVCSYAAYPERPPKPTLTVPSGSEMVFRYGGQNPPDSVSFGAVPLNKNGTSTASADQTRFRSLKAYGLGVERTIPVELPQGEYIVEVFLKEQQNDVSYFFHVMVE